jgi:Flp pilus assembly pilin Flp
MARLLPLDMTWALPPEGATDPTMNRVRKRFTDTSGQGLVEYTLIVFLVAFVFWVAVKNTSVGDTLATDLQMVADCVSAPFSCTTGS